MKEALPLTDVVVTEGFRIPIGRFGGSLKDFEVYQLGALAIKGLLERSKIDLQLIDEVVMSHTRQDGTGTNPARNMALFGGAEARPGQYSQYGVPCGPQGSTHREYVYSAGPDTGGGCGWRREYEQYSAPIAGCEMARLPVDEYHH